MKAIIQFLLNGLAVVLASYLLPGVDVDGYLDALIVAIVLTIANWTVKPILILFTIPLTLATLGIFLLVINAIIILLVDWFVPGFQVASFWWALAFSIILSLLNWFFADLTKEKKE
ncbi:MAG: phage holin family protein [Bacteroidota bacterium]